VKVGEVLQLKGIKKISHADSIARAVIKEMQTFALNLKGISFGTLTPADKFLSDTSVLECTRYCVSSKVSAFTPGATVEQLQLVARVKQEQAAKRARLS
jgi:hypothetical protein